MNDPHLAEARLITLVKILLHHTFDFSRKEGVKVDRVPDGQDHGLRKRSIWIGYSVVLLSVWLFQVIRISLFHEPTPRVLPYSSPGHSPRSWSTFLAVFNPSTIQGTPPYVDIWKITSATSSLVAPTFSAAWMCKRSSS